MAETDLKRFASLIRGKLVELSSKQHVPHLASALSSVDLVVSVYWGTHNINEENLSHEERDRFILSKGHAAPVLYTALAYRELLSFDVLDRIAEVGSPLAEQPGPFCVPGVEWATGSLGHGLGVAIGMLSAGRIKGVDFRATVLLGDGECNEGSVWEAALLASAQKFSRLTVMVDWNRWQATARSNETMTLLGMREKWESFGWHAVEVDGHDIEAIQSALRDAEGEERPSAIIAHTMKGKGIDFMEDDNNWHYRIPKPEEVVEAKRQLGVL